MKVLIELSQEKALKRVRTILFPNPTRPRSVLNLFALILFCCVPTRAQLPRPVNVQSLKSFEKSTLVYDSVTCATRISFEVATELYFTSFAVDTVTSGMVKRSDMLRTGPESSRTNVDTELPMHQFVVKSMWRRGENLVINISRSYEWYCTGDPSVLIGADLVSVRSSWNDDTIPNRDSVFMIGSEMRQRDVEWTADTLHFPDSSLLTLHMTDQPVKDCSSLGRSTRVFLILEHAIGVVYVRQGSSMRYVHEKTLTF